MKYPQEDHHYFKKLKKNDNYVQTDKYTLKRLYDLCAQLPDHEKLPSIMSVYGKKVEPK